MTAIESLLLAMAGALIISVVGMALKIPLWITLILAFAWGYYAAGRVKVR